MVAYRRNDDGTIEVAPTWSSLAERKIQAAIAEGQFDGLARAGQPLDLRVNPFEGDKALGHHMLKNAGFAPDWILQRRTIDAERANLEQLLATCVERWRHAGQRLPNLDHLEAALERRRLRQWREQQLELFLQAVGKVNRQIDSYNLTVPFIWLHQPRLRLDDEQARFESLLPKL